MKTLSFLIVSVLVCACSISDYNDSDYKDFEVSIVGTNYAKVSIHKLYGDSSLVIYDTFDSEYVSSLHYTNISSGKYRITAECNHQNLKYNTVQQEVTYNGRSASYSLYFERK